MSCDPASPKNSKWPTDEAVEFPNTVLQWNTRQARPNLVPTSTSRLQSPSRPPYTPPIPTHMHVPDHCAAVSPHVRKSNTVLDLDSTPWIPDSRTGFRTFCQWNVKLRFQKLVGFRIPWSVFRIPEAKFPGFRNPHSLTRGELSMVNCERTGPKNLTIPHADTWVRWELLKIDNVRLHYGAGFHQWMGYLRYPLKSETAAVCEETEKETMVSISNLRHAMYLIFVVAACLFCRGRRCCCCCLILLVLFFVYSNLFLVCLFACLVFFLSLCLFLLLLLFFFFQAVCQFPTYKVFY